MLIRAMLGGLLLLLVIGALISGLERVAPNPSRRYTSMPRTAAVEGLPDPEPESPLLQPLTALAPHGLRGLGKLFDAWERNKE